MRQDEAQGAATLFADLVAGTVWEDVAAQEHEAKRSILNFFASTWPNVIVCRLRCFGSICTSAKIPKRFCIYFESLPASTVLLSVKDR